MRELTAIAHLVVPTVRTFADTSRANGRTTTASNAPPWWSVDTDVNNHTGYLTTAQGAAVVVRLATLGADGPTGGFFSEGGPVPW